MSLFNLNAGYGLLTALAMRAGIRTSGKLFFVGDSGTTDEDRLKEILKADPDGVLRYHATVDAAINAASASAGAIILMAENHAEALSNATTLNADKAGIRIVGLGAGSDRPTITLDTATTATIPVSAADISFENIIFNANFADIVAVFTLTTANNLTLKGCSFKAAGANLNFLHIADTSAVSNDADGLTIEDCKWIEPDLLTETMVKMDGDNADVTLRNNFVQLGLNNNTPALMAIVAGKSVLNAQIDNNRVFRLNTDTLTGAILVSTDQSDNSGIISRNYVQHADILGELLVTASSGFGFMENYASGVAGLSGYLLPAADA